jgi:hypothetical protein
MRQSRTSGSVGALGGQLPRATRLKLPYSAESRSAPPGDISRTRPSLPSRGLTLMIARADVAPHPIGWVRRNPARNPYPLQPTPTRGEETKSPSTTTSPIFRGSRERQSCSHIPINAPTP